MKGVVLEVRDGFAAVLREDGSVEKIRYAGRVGETIELETPGRTIRFPRRAVRWTAAAAAAVVLLSAGGTWGFNNAYAYSYVTLDANPSIEYTLNRRNRVIGVSALNEDGTAIAESLAAEVKNSSLTEAMEKTTALLYAAEYLSDGDCVLVNVTSRGSSQQESLSQELDAYFQEEAAALEVHMTGATPEERKAAGELGVSAGRYMVLREIGERDGQPLREEAERLGGAAVNELFRPESPQPGASEEPGAADETGVPAGAPEEAPSEEPSFEPAAGGDPDEAGDRGETTGPEMPAVPALESGSGEPAPEEAGPGPSVTEGLPAGEASGEPSN